MSTTTHSYPSSAIVAVVVAVVLWSSTYVGIRMGLHDFSPGAMGLLRYAIASVVMAVLYYRLPHKTRLTGKNAVLLLLTGAIGIGAYNILINAGEQEVNAATTGFILGFMPIIITIGAMLFFKEKLKLLGVISMIISFAGLTVIFIDQTRASIGAGAGVLYLCGALATGGFYNLMQRRLTRVINPLEVVSWCIWSATLASGIYLPELMQQLPHASAKGISVVVYLGIFPAAIAYASWSYAIKHLPLVKIAPSFFLIPILTAILGWILLGETMDTSVIIGGILILTGSILTLRR